MNFLQYYKKNKTFLVNPDYRIKKIIEIVESINPKKIADIGCGGGLILDMLSQECGYRKQNLIGVDVYNSKESDNYQYIQADITQEKPLENNSFDLIILGEVIEHVPNPDFLLENLNLSLKRGGVLIVSTPNLVSWANRILVLAGVQPLYTETSSDINLGRYFKFLGQGAKTQGHLKIFTSQSLKEILERKGFQVTQKYGVPFFFPFPISVIDMFFTQIVSLASGLLFVAKK